MGEVVKFDLGLEEAVVRVLVLALEPNLESMSRSSSVSGLDRLVLLRG